MIIHAELCDHCGKPANPGVAFESYKLEGSAVVYHICPSCQDKPFKRVVEPHPDAVAVRRTLYLLLGFKT